MKPMAFQKITEYQRKIKIIKKSNYQTNEPTKIRKREFENDNSTTRSNENEKNTYVPEPQKPPKKEKSLYSQIKLLQHIVNLENSFDILKESGLIYDKKTLEKKLASLNQLKQLLSNSNSKNEIEKETLLINFDRYLDVRNLSSFSSSRIKLFALNSLILDDVVKLLTDLDTDLKDEEEDEINNFVVRYMAPFFNKIFSKLSLRELNALIMDLIDVKNTTFLKKSITDKFPKYFLSNNKFVIGTTGNIFWKLFFNHIKLRGMITIFTKNAILNKIPFKILEHTPTLLSQYVSSVLNVFKKQIPSKIKIPMQLCELYGETKQIYIKSEEFVILDIGKWIFDQMFNEVNNQILKFLKHQKGNKILIPASSNPAVDLVVQLELEDGSMKHYIMQMKHYLKSKISEKTKTNFKKNANLFVSNMHKLGMSPKTTQFLFIGTMDKNGC